MAFAAMLLLYTACSKEDEPLQYGEIEGYVKLEGYYQNSEFVSSDIFGVYIVSEENDSLLTFNISASTLQYLLKANVASLNYGVSKIHIPVSFSYRNATAEERKTTVIPDGGNISNFSQIIIIDIRKAKTNTGGGENPSAECCS
jgi:hypothetical protein